MRTHNFRQAQDPASYASPIQSRISLATTPCAPGKHGTLAWVGTVLLRKALFWFLSKIDFSNKRTAFNSHLSASSKMMILCLPLGNVTFFCANILILFLTTSIPLYKDNNKLINKNKIK